jgi:hypothetical protein
MAAPQRTHYDVLGISRDADASTIKAAWKLHVQAWHPDRFTGEMPDEAERQAQQINEAYTTLRDSSRRAAYDCRIAAEEAAARPEPAPRSSHKVRPAAPRAAAAPVGSPMPMPEPATLGEQVASMSRDAWAVVRRHPRVFAAAATIWVVVYGGSMVMHAVSGPSLPATADARPVAAAAPMVSNDAQQEELEDLAERARQEAAEADAEMAQLMREDAAIAAAEAKAIAREQALAAAAARKAAKSGKAGASGASGAAPKRGRVVRVMPNAAATP